MADHPNMRSGEHDYFDVRGTRIPAKTLTIFTGPLDKYFDYAAGELG